MSGDVQCGHPARLGSGVGRAVADEQVDAGCRLRPGDEEVLQKRREHHPGDLREVAVVERADVVAGLVVVRVALALVRPHGHPAARLERHVVAGVDGTEHDGERRVVGGRLRHHRAERQRRRVVPWHGLPGVALHRDRTVRGRMTDHVEVDHPVHGDAVGGELGRVFGRSPQSLLLAREADEVHGVDQVHVGQQPRDLQDRGDTARVVVRAGRPRRRVRCGRHSGVVVGAQHQGPRGRAHAWLDGHDVLPGVARARPRALTRARVSERMEPRDEVVRGHSDVRRERVPGVKGGEWGHVRREPVGRDQVDQGRDQLVGQDPRPLARARRRDARLRRTPFVRDVVGLGHGQPLSCAGRQYAQPL